MGSGLVTARLGTGASASGGGSVAPGEGFELSFQVTVDPGTEGLTVANTVTVRYTGALAPIPFEVTVTPPEGALTVVGSSDLSVELTGPAGPVPAGGTVPFAVVVRNGGPSPAPPTSVVTVLPPGLVLDPAGSDLSCAVDGADPARVSCPVPALAVGSSIELALVATVAPTLAPGAVTTSATVAVPAGHHDPDPANDVTSVETAIVPGAALRVTKVADVEPVEQGAPVVYTVTVENLGPRPATGVVLEDRMPDGLLLPAPPDGCTVDGTGRVVRCELGTLGVGAARAVALDAVVAPDVPPGTVIRQAASASAVEAPVPVTATAATTVVVPGGVVADLSLTKRLLSDVLEPGLPAAYEITVVNGGPSPATVLVVDRVPTGLEGQMWSCPSPACAVAGGSGDVEVEVALAAGESVALRVDATVSASAPASVFNIARLVLPVTVVDPVRADNAALVLASTVPNSPPAPPSGADPVTIAAGETIVIDPFDYVSDADGALDPSTVCVVEVRPASEPGVTSGAGCGTGSVVGAVSVDPVTGAITYTAPETLDGPLVLTFEVCDLRGGCVQVTLDLAVVGEGLATTGADLDRLAVAGLLVMVAGVFLLGLGAVRGTAPGRLGAASAPDHSSAVGGAVAAQTRRSESPKRRDRERP